MAIVVLGSVRFAPENMEKIRPHLKALAEATNKNDGCVCYDVAEDLFDPGLVRFSEIWPTEESFEGHIKAPHIAPWREASQAVGIIERHFTVFDVENQRPLQANEVFTSIGDNRGMQNAARYREFAETLIAAAKDCGEEAREVVLAAAAAWTALAEAEERAATGETNVVDFAEHRRQRAG